MSWSGQNVLITGGLGFIGSNLAIRLVREGARVSICDARIEGYGANDANIREIRDDVEVQVSDVRDDNVMGHLVAGKDVVFHLAAQVSHVMSLSNPFPDIDINIKGTAAVLEACRRRNPGALVVRSGTRGQYGPAVALPVSEEAPSDPRGLYEISQLSAEMICRAYTRIHGIRTVPLRLTNVYGPRAQMKHSQFGVVNWFVRLALEGRPIPIFGTGKILRDFLYVDDCVEALVRAAREPRAVGEILNVGNDRASTFLEVA
jgi:UDP-glucose 4-epimerase